MQHVSVQPSGNKQSLEEVKNPIGVDSKARFELGEWIYLAEVAGDEKMLWQEDNFRVGTYDQIYPKLRLIDDATTWVPGKNLFTIIIIMTL